MARSCWRLRREAAFLLQVIGYVLFALCLGHGAADRSTVGYFDDTCHVRWWSDPEFPRSRARPAQIRDSAFLVVGVPLGLNGFSACLDFTSATG